MSVLVVNPFARCFYYTAQGYKLTSLHSQRDLLVWKFRYLNLSHVVRNTAFCKCENRDTDQLQGNHKADPRLCFRYIDSTVPLLPKYENFKHLAIFCGCTAQFVSDLVGNPEDGFYHEAHFKASGVIPLAHDQAKLHLCC